MRSRNRHNLAANASDLFEREYNLEELVRLADLPVRRLHRPVFVILFDCSRRWRETLGSVVLPVDPFRPRREDGNRCVESGSNSFAGDGEGGTYRGSRD